MKKKVYIATFLEPRQGNIPVRDLALKTKGKTELSFETEITEPNSLF